MHTHTSYTPQAHTRSQKTTAQAIFIFPLEQLIFIYYEQNYDVSVGYLQLIWNDCSYEMAD